MKKKVLFFMVTLISTICLGQKKILPGDPLIDKSLLPKGKSIMGYNIKYGNKLVEIATYETEINIDNTKFSVTTLLNFQDSDKQWKNISSADAKTFKAVKRYSQQDDRTFSLNFGTLITGDYTDNKTGKKNIVKQAIKENYFEVSIYPYILQMLPLNVGYRAIIPVYDYEAEHKDRIYNVIVKEVKSDIYMSQLTGKHLVWKVSVFEENSGNNFDYYFDKDTHRMWQADIVTKKGDVIVVKDKEFDFNPFKTAFNKEETYKLVTEGNSAIKGVAFARDNESRIKGIAILNINKKQFAEKGTQVTLIPYTDYFKEWIELNKKRKKTENAPPIPLPEEAFKCFKFSAVYDDEGNFEFTNLKSGEYLLVTSFEYVHNFKRTEEVGRAAVYVNGGYQGDHIFTQVFSYSKDNVAAIEKVVTVKNDGDIVQVKLKKTL